MDINIIVKIENLIEDYSYLKITYKELIRKLEINMKKLNLPLELTQNFIDDLSEEQGCFWFSLVALNILKLNNLDNIDKIYYITRFFYASETLKEWIEENHLEPLNTFYKECYDDEFDKVNISLFDIFRKRK